MTEAEYNNLYKKRFAEELRELDIEEYEIEIEQLIKINKKLSDELTKEFYKIDGMKESIKNYLNGL